MVSYNKVAIKHSQNKSLVHVYMCTFIPEFNNYYVIVFIILIDTTELAIDYKGF